MTCPPARLEATSGSRRGDLRTRRGPVALLRAHAPFAVLLVAGAGLRLVTHLAYRPALFYNDTFQYLSNAALDPTGIWPAGYALLLRPLLWFDDLAVIPVAHHLLGLGIGVLLYVLLTRWGAGRWLAALATAPVLLDAYQLQSEQRILAETFFTAMIVVALAALSWQRRPGIAIVVAAGLLLGLAVPVRLVGLALVVPAALAVAIDAGTLRRAAVRAGALVVAFAIPVAAYGAWYQHVDGEFRLSPEWLTPRMLYARVAGFVDCDALDVPAGQRGLCPTARQQVTMATDNFNWRPESPLNQWEPPPGVDRNAAVSDFAWRVIREQPLDLAGAVALDILKAFAPAKEQFQHDTSIERWRFQVEDLRHEQRAREAVAVYGGAEPRIVQPLAGWLRDYQLHGGYVPPIVLGLAMLAGLTGGVVAWRRGRPDLAACCALWSLAGAVLVVLPATYQFSWRYQVPTFALFPVAGAFGVLAARPGAAGVPAAESAPAAGARDPSRPAPESLDAVDAVAREAFLRRYGRPDLGPLAVVIAAYDEADGIGDVLARVPARVCGVSTSVLVVDDGSSDATAEVAERAGALVCRAAVNRGQGAALRLGYHIARLGGADYIATLDADGQYDPAELEMVVAPLLSGEADFVTGSRRLGREETTDALRRVGVRVFARLASVLAGQRITDTSNGLRAMRAEVAATVTLRQPQYQASELLMGALAHGFRVVERATTIRERAAGTSKKGNDLIYGLRYATVLVSTWWRERATRARRDRTPRDRTARTSPGRPPR